jgi:hypothetical protein
MEPSRVCSVDGCEKPTVARRLCNRHYQRSRKHLRKRSQCSIEDCTKPVQSRGWCDMHYRRWWTNGSTKLKPKSVLTCSVNGCTSVQYAHEMCRMHYRRCAKTGSPGAVGYLRQRNNSSCCVDRCERPSRKRGMCNMHYMRWQITGDPGPAELYYRVYQESCDIDGCNSGVRARGLCSSHYAQWRWKYGTHERLVDDSFMKEYKFVHQKLPFWRGSAKQHKCGCGSQAEEWAYMNACPNEKQSKFGAYSLDPYEYAPLCIPCHRRMDRGIRRQKRLTKRR